MSLLLELFVIGSAVYIAFLFRILYFCV